jgi:hypothetical protein
MNNCASSVRLPVTGEQREASARSFRDSMARSESRMAKKMPKEYKSGQSILVELSGRRIVEARVNHLIQDRDGIKLQVDFGHDETALIEICRC